MCLGWYKVCQDFTVSGYAYETASSGKNGRMADKLPYHGMVCAEGDSVDDVAATLDSKIDEFCTKPITLIDGRRFECRKQNFVENKGPVQVTKLKGFLDIVFEFFAGLFS